MATARRFNPEGQGVQYRVFTGCDVLDGEIATATADEIIGGWAPTRKQAEQQAREVLKNDA